MKLYSILCAAAALMMGAGTAAADLPGKSLTVYFSRYDNSLQRSEQVDANTMASVLISDHQPTGTTAYVAAAVAERTGSPLFAIRTVQPLTADDQALIAENHQQQRAAALPAIAELPDISGVDTIFLGFPVWATTAPRAVISLVSQLDLEGKNLVLFVTHDGYGAGRSQSDVSSYARGARVLPEILSISSTEAADCQAAVERFVSRIEAELK